ncbi:late exocytosis, associated with Golgi transport-domain-containing protein [Haematococcus lacustris]
MEGSSPGRHLLNQEAQLAGQLLANNRVTDQNIRSSLIIDVCLGGALILLFSVLQRSSVLYRFRLVSPSVTHKPPPLPTGGLRSIIGWVACTYRTSDLELLKSCGLDALMMVKVSALGVQLFLPATLIGLLLPFAPAWPTSLDLALGKAATAPAWPGPHAGTAYRMG